MKRYCRNASKCSLKAVNGCEYHETCPCFAVDLNEYQKPKSKYHNQKCEYNGLKFDSKKELNRYLELCLLERSGRIKGLKRQVKYVLIDKTEHNRECSYFADFEYEENGVKVVEDVKSKATKTAVYKVKKKLMYERYGITIKEV